jgi:hypothetical protein
VQLVTAFARRLTAELARELDPRPS